MHKHGKHVERYFMARDLLRSLDYDTQRDEWNHAHALLVHFARLAQPDFDTIRSDRMSSGNVQRHRGVRQFRAPWTWASTLRNAEWQRGYCLPARSKEMQERLRFRVDPGREWCEQAHCRREHKRLLAEVRAGSSEDR